MIVKELLRTSVITAIVLLSSNVNADQLNDALRAADKCSLAAIHRYAATLPDPVEAVVLAAFQGCGDEWKRAADLSSGWGSIKTIERLKSAQVFLDEAKAIFIARRTPLVFELRAKALEKK
jgi:hypothetical protein